MRRFVLSLASLGALALTACSGGGSVLNFSNSNTPDAVIITTATTSNIARVLPGAALPLSAQATRNGGFLSNNRFRWSAMLTTGGTYTANSLGQQKPCGGIAVAGAPFTSDLNFPPYSTIAIDPTNESNILFIPPVIFPPPAGSPPGTTVAITYPYCVTVSATALDENFHPQSAVGSITVAVVNPQAPLQ